VNPRTFALASLTALSGAAIYGLYAALAGAAAVAVPACTETDAASTTTLITGITVRSGTLTMGHGCGTAYGEVYKFAAVVTNQGDPSTVIASGTYDCFADGTFAQLLPEPDGGENYDVYVYAFDATTWNANQEAITCAVSLSKSGAGICLHADGAALLGFQAVLGQLSTWSTTCTASQQSTIEVVAECPALTATAQ
jgi:hypothetical protein